MKAAGRYLLLGVILTVGVVLLAGVLSEKSQTPLGRTLAPLFTFMGRSTKTLDRLLSRVMPVDSVDESLLGEAIKARYRRQGATVNPAKEYLQAIVDDLGKKQGSRYHYEVFLERGGINAFALPGGVILVTPGLIDILDTEAQIASILAHEMGHVERGHCFDGVRFELISRKLGSRSLGEIADIAYGIATRIHFSKTQEAEADEWGFKLMASNLYYPPEMAAAFERLKGAHLNPSDRIGLPDPFRDYLDSHPPIELRIENYREKATRWLQANPGRYYVGTRNYRERLPRARKTYEEEFH